MEWAASPILLVPITISFIALLGILFNRNGGRRLPPGPIGFPLLGRLPFLSPDLHRCFADLARTYGPVLSFRLGAKLCVVISSPSAATEVLRVHDAIFANHSPPVVATIATGNVDIIWAPNGPHWRMLRKVAVRELLGNSAIDSFASLRRKELRRIFDEMQSRTGDAVNVRNIAYAASLNVIMSMVWGGKLDDGLVKEAREVIEGIVDLLGAPNISDFLPVLAPLDLQGLQRRMRGWCNRYDVIFDHIIRKSEETNYRADGGGIDFLGLLLDVVARRDPDMPLQLDHVKSMLLDDFHLDGHPNAFNFVFDIVHDRPKDWKCTVKSMWTTHEKKSERLKEELLKDPRIDATQFSNAVKECTTHESKAKALINKNNSKGKILHHRCGRRPLSAKRHDFEKENQREPTDIEMMKIMYPKEEKVDEIERYIERSNQDHPNLSSENIMSKAYSHVVGARTDKYVRLLGTGHEKTHKRFEYEKLQASLQRNRDEHESTKKLKSVVASQATLIQQQKAWMQQYALWMHRVSQHVGMICHFPYPQNVSDFSQMSGSTQNSGDRNNGNSSVNTNGGIGIEDMPFSYAFGFPSQAGGNPVLNPYGGTPMDPSLVQSRINDTNQGSFASRIRKRKD